MPDYRFEFHEGPAVETIDGVSLADDAAARREVMRYARETMADGILEGIDRSSWSASVYDASGRLVAEVEFSNLLKKPGSLE
ncbi:MAG: hypothetical protein ABTQ31_15730 [Rhizobiaceae bacterium]